MAAPETSQSSFDFKIGSFNSKVSIDKEKGTLSWEVKDKKTTSERCVPASDILTTTSTTADKWRVHYASRTKTRWRVDSVTFTTNDGELLSQCTHQVSELISTSGKNRPKRLLNKQACKTYRKNVEPLLKLMEVTSESIVTKSGGHIEEVISEYDLSSVDGVVCLGGDGTFQKLVAAMIKWQMRKEGKDLNNKEEDISKTSVRVGLIPCGTGQGMARALAGIDEPDVTTSILHILLGFEVCGSTVSVYVDDKFIDLSVMQCVYGLFGDLMEHAEARRHMGKFRYFYSMSAFLWKHVRTFNLELSMLLDSQRDETGTSSPGEWSTHTGDCCMINMFLILGAEPLSVYASWTGHHASLHTIATNAGKTGIIKYVYKFSTRKSLATLDYLKEYTVKAMKFNLPTKPDGSTLHHCLNLDGEVYPVTTGTVYARVHQKVVWAFGGAHELAVAESLPANN